MGSPKYGRVSVGGGAKPGRVSVAGRGDAGAVLKPRDWDISGEDPVRHVSVCDVTGFRPRESVARGLCTGAENHAMLDLSGDSAVPRASHVEGGVYERLDVGVTFPGDGRGGGSAARAD